MRHADHDVLDAVGATALDEVIEQRDRLSPPSSEKRFCAGYFVAR